MLKQIDLIVPAFADGRRGPLSDAVDGHYGGFAEWAREERTGSVRLMVFRVDQGALVIFPQCFPDFARQE